MSTDVDNTIYGGNGYKIEHSITKDNDPDGSKVAAAGLAGLTGSISATPDGTPIHASLSIPLTERSAKPGTYYGRITGTNIDAHMWPTYDGAYVYVIIESGDGEIEGVTKVKAKAVRKI